MPPVPTFVPASDPPPPALVWTMVLGFAFFASAGAWAVLRSRGRSRRAVASWSRWAAA
ncbi:MAG: hypothetical protein R3F30_04055 [Planctomycetota bacterium]